MDKIQIFTDSTTSLSPEECKKLNLEYVETSYMLDGELHSAFDAEDVSLPEFYKKLTEIKSCSTGCVNPITFEEAFERYVSKGTKVLYTGLSASLSSTFENAKIVAEKLNKKYGKKVVAVVDSRSASYGTLALIERAKEYIDAGKTLEKIEEDLDKDAKSMSVAFVAHDLNFLYRSGRLNALEAGLGKLFKIVPIVYVSESGKLKLGDKCLGSKLAYKTLKTKFTNFIKTKTHTKCYITSCDMPAEVEELKQYILENTDLKEKDIKTGPIDKTLACCCGPKTVAIFCL